MNTLELSERWTLFIHKYYSDNWFILIILSQEASAVGSDNGHSIEPCLLHIVNDFFVSRKNGMFYFQVVHSMPKSESTCLQTVLLYIWAKQHQVSTESVLNWYVRWYCSFNVSFENESCGNYESFRANKNFNNITHVYNFGVNFVSKVFQIKKIQHNFTITNTGCASIK